MKIAQTVPRFQKYLGTKRNIKFKPDSSIVHCQKVPPYSNISKKCLLCLHKKLEILIILNQRNYLTKDLNLYLSVGMLINFYCAVIKQSVDCNPLIGKQKWIKFWFHIVTFVITSLIYLKIAKYMKLKVAKK